MTRRRSMDRLAASDSPASRAVAWVGVAFIAIGLVGVAVLPRLYVLWVALIFFGGATIPRAIWEWIKERRSARKSRGQ
jgi:fatty acid desaturase